MSSNVIRYQILEHEAIHGLLLVRSWTVNDNLLQTWIIILVFGALSVFYTLRPYRHGAVLPTVLIIGTATLALIALLLPLYVRRAITRVVHRNPGIFTEPQEVVFDEHGMSGGSASLKQELAWALFKRRRMHDDFIYLFSDRYGMVAMIPERAFTPHTFQEFLRCTQSLASA